MSNAPNCHLVVSGKIEAKKITKAPPLSSFWKLEKKPSNKKGAIFHGQEWHRKTTGEIEDYFTSQGYKIIREPTLHYGRADLGIFKEGAPDLYIEVGTTSFYKLWLNLETMKNFVYLIVPNDKNLIEFRQEEKTNHHAKNLK